MLHTSTQPDTAPSIRLSGLSKTFGNHRAVNGVDIDIPAGRLSVFLGPSGCGKSTLLRLIAGFEIPDAGRIEIGGREVSGLPPSRRDIAMVFQNYALFPHLSVAENITFGLDLRRVARAERAARLDRVARMMGLDSLLSRKPAQLSGGQQQRVALARAVISERPVCLMDEPLSNLDARLRAEMRAEIRALQRRLGLTMIYVTHDQIEAMTMADQIVLLNEGRVVQSGTPVEIYERPANAFAARFIGTPPMNLCPAADLGLPGNDLVGIRPEDLSLSASGPGVPARIAAREYHGADLMLSVVVGGASLLVRLPARDALPDTDRLLLNWHPGSLHRFSADAGGVSHPPLLAGAPSPARLAEVL